MLGDNLFEDSLVPYLECFRKQEKGAKVLLKHVIDPERYGIAYIGTDNKSIISIEENPVHHKSNFCVVGIYMYGSSVFEYIANTTVSERGELEISGVNKKCILRSI
ncbi:MULTISPECIES: sugar phosphate nucleotidyltransferase [Bacillus]|uniref:sugar phosphate nucleotidyltransferase n=1 Tax=Bacillus TaxID=1386 RepID=UPI0035B506F9